MVIAAILIILLLLLAFLIALVLGTPDQRTIVRNATIGIAGTLA